MMKTITKLTPAALVLAAASATPTLASTVDANSWSEIRVQEAKLTSVRKRHQVTLPAKAGETGIFFRVKQNDDHTWTASCNAVQGQAEKKYFMRDTDHPTTAESNVSYRHGEEFVDGSVSVRSMMGFPLADTVGSRLGNQNFTTITADVETHGYSDYMMVPNDPNAMMAEMLLGSNGVDAASSETKLVEVTYGGETYGDMDVSETFQQCVTDYMNNPEAVEAAIAEATKDFDFAHSPVPDANPELLNDLVGSLRDKEMLAIVDEHGATTAEVRQLDSATGGLIPATTGVSVTDPETGDVHTSFLCLAGEVVDQYGNRTELRASQTVLQGQHMKACAADSESVAKREIIWHSAPVQMSVGASASAAAAASVRNGGGNNNYGSSFGSVGFGSWSTSTGDVEYGDFSTNITKIINKGDVTFDIDKIIKEGDAITQYFNECGVQVNGDNSFGVIKGDVCPGETVTETPETPTTPSPVPLPLPGFLLAGGLSGLAALKRRRPKVA